MNQQITKCSLVKFIDLEVTTKKDQKIWILIIDGGSADNYCRAYLT